ncbi:DUF4347 domain-containing protein [Pantoea sp. Tr-811]|uniref:DUF4347 domain-containing protein n=1 Tax=Pantoea sp. Tr-811 TaxID=2608361 RepID=UPI001422CB8B|nr:DUF4347 domain-containing protein [Pantoea sp. Tr-811]NIF30162.1 DUF4347 domain-containing protein [Pantoea sp. Tr-811]
MKFIERFARRQTAPQPAAEAVGTPLLMALEPRIMFDASVAVVAQDATAQATADAAKDTASSADAASQAPVATADTRSTQSERHEVVFIDGQVANVEQLVAGLGNNAEVVVLDPNKDGLQQMADYLKGRENLDAIHLLSHGADGTVQLGNVWLASNNLAQHSDALQSIGAALKADGDLLLYGCRVGESANGQAFLDDLASLTGADVAASADDTGAASLGGNWTLERSTGLIETTALGAQMDGYQSLLAVSFSGGVNGTTPTVTTGTQMRYVLGDFNNDGISDILYQTGTAAGSAWLFSAGRADGTFETAVAQGSSPFANVTLIDAAAAGYNYYAADFDGDGDTDLLGVTTTSGPAYLYRNVNGTFTREIASGFNGTQYGVRLVVGDFNGDGAADILYQPGSVDTSNSWRYALNNGDGTFTDTALASTVFSGLTLPGYLTYNYRVVDFDGDGDLDIFVFTNNTTGTLYRNDGTAFTSVTIASAPMPAFAARALIGDFDGDGDADIFYQSAAAVGSAWLYAENLGNGTFAAAVTQNLSPFAGVIMTDFANQNVRVADMDGDGDLDVVGTAAGQNFSVYYQSGSTPKLVSSTPADDTLNVSPTANITLTFSQSVTKGTGNIYIVRTSDNVVVQTISVSSGQVTGSGTTWTIDPSDLAQGVAYAVRIDSKTFVNADGKVFLGILNNTRLNFTTATNAAPVVSNLNGDAVSYSEKGSGVLIDAGSNALVTDADSSNFGGGNVRVSVTGGAVSGEDVLSIRNAGTAAGQIAVSGSNVLYGGVIIGSFTGGSGGNALVVSLNANATPSAVSALLQNLVYSNSNSTAPNTGTRTISVSVTDDTGTSSTAAAVTVNVLAVNDPPQVTANGTNPTFTEDGAAVAVFSGAAISTVESGQTINQLTLTVSNLANGIAEKLVIDGSDVTLTNGTSVVTFGNGLIVSVSVASGTATLTITHGGLSTATAQSILNSIAYRNDSNAPTGTLRTVTLTSVRDSGGTSNGGIDTSALSITSVVTLVAVNDAPVLSGGPSVIAATNEDTTSNAVAVSTILAGASYSDADADAASGIAIIATAGRGTWQYSTDGTTWTSFGSVSTSSALLLASTSQVRYIPDGANGENVSFTYRAWDHTTGTAATNGSPNTGDTTANGGTTAYSTGTAQVTLIVTSVNDAPVITPVNPTLPGLTDTATNNIGSGVSTLLGGVTDVDSGALKGIVVTGITGTYGTWQFSTDNGATWINIGSASDTYGLLLSPADRLRFVPDGVHGETATVTYRAWDQTGGTQGLQGLRTNVAGLTGGSNAYSSATDTASVVVTAVNDAPVVTGSGGSVAWTEGNNVTSTPVIIDSGLIVSDPDGPSIASATVSLGGSYVLGEDTLGITLDAATTGNITAMWNAITGTLTLSAAGGATQAQFQEALRSVTYTNNSDTPTTTTRTVSIKVNDGSLDSNVVTRNVTLTAVNDAPQISAPTNVSVTEDTLSPVTGIVISDVDSSSGTLTLTVAAGNLSGVSTGGVSVAGSGSALVLTGTLSSINAYIAAGNLKYTTALNANGSVTLGISVDTASVATVTRSLTLDITPVNDAPTITMPVSINVTEDVAMPLSGISFADVDAGSGSVTVTFSVASGNGTLTGSPSSGVAIAGSGTNSIVLEGTVGDINSMISNGHLSYLGAANATGVKTLSISINDNGNTGSGGPLTVSADLSLVIAAVNDAPVNSLPPSQTVLQDNVLTFSTGNGNLISVSDVDIGANPMVVTLTANHGLLTLSQTTGLSFIVGNGSSNATMTFSGSLSDINAALNGLTFAPTAGYFGTGSLTIESNDQGNSGSGGAKSDIDTLLITVSPANPKVVSVTALPGSDGQHKVGDTVYIVVNFDNAVVVDLTGGQPSLLLETGAIDREAVYISGSGSNQLVFRYTVQAGDTSADLDYASTASLHANGAVLQSGAGYSAVLTLPTVGGANSLGGQQAIVVDGIVPTISSVTLPADGNYRLGQNLDFVVNFSEAVTVDSTGGTPRLAVTLDNGGIVYADYLSGSGGSALVFRLTVASGQLDTNGISVGNTLQLNGGSVRDQAGNASTTAFTPGNSSGILVDGVVPSVASVAVPANGSYKAGEVLSFTVNTSEAVFASGAPRLALDIGGTTRYATLVAGSSGGSTLVFEYTVQAGDNDADGISVASSLDLNGGSVKDAAGNDMNLILNSVGSTAEVVVDSVAPSVASISRAGASPTNSGSLSYTVTFSEAVSGVDLSDFSVTFGGSASGSLASITQVDGRTYSVLINNLSGAGDVTLSLNGSGTGIADAAGNAISGGLSGETYAVDRLAPVVNSVSVPGNGTYVAGQHLDFIVNLDENTQVDTSGGTPRIAVTLGNGEVAYAQYLSGSGSAALVFRLTVANGQLDSDGISLGNAIELNGGTLRDYAGNDANLQLNNVADTRGVLVDAVVPVIASVDVPASGSYKAGDVLSFTVNTSEGVVADTLGGTPRLVLTVGGVTRYASYVSGGADGALLFQYTVQAGDTASGGIGVNSTLDLNGGHFNDPAGNALALSLNGLGSTANVLIDTTTPYATSITRLDTTPSTSASVSYSVTFSEQVLHVDASDFNLVFGGDVAGSIQSVSSTDGITYTVTLGGLTGTGTVRLDLKPGTDITDAAGNLIPGGRVGVNYAIDRVAPSVSTVAVPANGTYVAGQNLDFIVNLDENTRVDTSGGTPRIAVTLGNGEVAYAQYLSGSGLQSLVFRLTIANGQLDSDGISLGNAIELNGGTLRDNVGNDANLQLNNVADTRGVLVDAVVPVIASVDVPASGSYKAGDVLSFTVNTSEGVVADTLGGTPRLVLTVGGVTRYASYVSGGADGALLFQYTVQAGDTASGGIGVNNTLDLNGGHFNDPAGNALALSLNGLGSTANVLIDTTTPYATGITRVDTTPTNSATVSYRVTFSETVANVDASDFNLIFGGDVTGNIQSVSSLDGMTYTVTLANLSGTGTVRLDLKPGTDIADAAGNLVPGGRVGVSYSIDRVAPSVTAVDVPANGTYVAGQNLDFTVHMSEVVQLDTSNGSPRLAVTLDNGGTVYAEYLSGAGSSVLVFRLTITSGQLDTTGISVGSSLQLNGATLRDAVGNAAQTTLNGLPATDGILVDAVVPTVATVTLPSPGAYNAGDVLRFTVNASEPVVVDTSTGTPRLAVNIGGVTRYATYVSGSGTSALVFEYSIQPGNNSTSGISLGASIDLDGGSLTDAAGNAMNLALNGTGSGAGIVVDTVAPQVSDIVRVDTTPSNASTVRYTVTFDESVSGVDSADFSLAFTGSASGRIASVEQVNGRTYTIVVDNLSGAGNVRLDLNASGTGITDVAGNPISGGLAGSVYSIDRVAPSVTGVTVPASGTYVAGQQLDFTVNTDEAVLVDTGDGAPRLAITLDNGRVVYADYLAGSGGSALVFRLNVTSGMAGNGNFSVAPAIDLNGGSIRDARGNDAVTALNNVGDTSGILVDARAPRATSIVVDGPVLPTDRSLSFTLTFDEPVSGVDASDFSVLGTNTASGVVQQVQRIDASTYRIVVGSLRGQGTLALSLNALGSGIQDAAGNAMALSLVGQAQGIQTQDVGDLQYRLNPPQALGDPRSTVLQPQVPGPQLNESVSPLLPGALFEVRSVGGDIQPLGTIFLGNASSAPSFIAQVFGSSDSAAVQAGFGGFASGGNGVFGSSTLAAIFSHEVPGVSDMNVFNGSQWRPADLSQGLRGVFGVPTFGQQLQQLNDAEQRQVRDLAQALAQPAQIGRQA